MNPSDRVFLQATVELAERGRFSCAPNPTVGCLIVRQGLIIGRGFHALAGADHAEVNAIKDAGGDVAGSTVYVSLEPCAFVGRTPACAQTLIDVDVARVVIAAEDPHPQVAGAGIKMLRAAGIEVSLLTQAAALEAIAGYSCRIYNNRPLVRIKSASSIDGGTALASGESQWITGDAARADVQYWRARSDAIITGVNSVLADDPQLNVRAADYIDTLQPLRVVLDTHIRTPESAQLVQDGAATLIVHDADTSVPRYLENYDNVELLGLSGGPRDLETVLTHLADSGCNEVLVEAGAQVCGSFAAAALWDEWLCYVAPKWLGAGHRGLADFDVATLDAAPVGKILDMKQIGDDMRIRFVAAGG